MPRRNQVHVKRGFGRQGLVGEVVLAGQVQVAVGEHGRGRERGQRGGLLLGRQPGQVLREVQVVPGAGGGVKLLVAPVPAGPKRYRVTSRVGGFPLFV